MPLSSWTSSLNLLEAQSLRPRQDLWNWNTIPWPFLCAFTLQSTEMEKVHDQVLLVRNQALVMLEVYMFYGPVLQNIVCQRCPVKKKSIQFVSFHRNFYSQVRLGHNFEMLCLQTCDHVRIGKMEGTPTALKPVESVSYIPTDRYFRSLSVGHML